MLVRCGRCRVELEIAAPGEFACPNCGTRNVVRGDPMGGIPDLGAQGGAAGAGLVGGLGGGLTGTGGLGTRPAPPEPEGPPPGIEWIKCPACTYRFVVGEVETVPCPSCGRTLALGDGAIRLAEEG